MEKNCKSCSSCHHFSHNMCVCERPKVKNAPFGFPLKYNSRNIDCKSYKKREFDFNWNHM